MTKGSWLASEMTTDIKAVKLKEGLQVFKCSNLVPGEGKCLQTKVAFQPLNFNNLVRICLTPVLQR